jgi:hypothetical protein
VRMDEVGTGEVLGFLLILMTVVYFGAHIVAFLLK